MNTIKNTMPKKKLKILAAGDLHGDSRQAGKLAKRATDEKVDLVILSGDLTNFGEPTKNLISPFKRRGHKVLLIPGNHDSFATADFMAEFYNVKNIHGYSVRYEDLGIFGCGGANVGIEALTEREILQQLEKAHKGIEYLNKRIMVTHVHPTKTRISKLTRWFPGSSGLERAVKKLKPDILLCSHVHEAEGVEEILDKTKVISVGKSGKIIEI